MSLVNIVRYVRWWMNDASDSVQSAWSQMAVYSASGTNVAAGKLVTVSAAMNSLDGDTTVAAGGTTGQLTNGAAAAFYATSSACIFTSGLANVVLDLTGAPQPIASIALWFFQGSSAYTFYDVQVDVSPDGSSNNWTTVFGPQSVANNSYSLATGFVIEIPQCFVAGTRIAVPGGETRVEDLRVGDAVLTSDAKGSNVVDTRHTAVYVRGAERMRPVRIPRGVLGATRDLLLSDRHGVVVDGRLVPAAHVQGARREPSPPPDDDAVVHYHHVALARAEAMLLAEGVACESLRR
jgi:hypothetical protein